MLQLSSSVGINGLHPVIFIFIGMSSSARSIFPKGNLAKKDALRKRGKPIVELSEPSPENGLPKCFHAGTGPSRTFAPFFNPFTEIAANVQGSLYTSGRFLIDTCESVPVPSIQIMPVPNPPIGNATRLRYSCVYAPLYSRLPAFGTKKFSVIRACWLCCACNNPAGKTAAAVPLNPICFKNERRFGL